MAITEGTQPAAVTWTGAWSTAQTTASFVPESGALLVALVCGSGIGGGAGVTASITDSLGGSWTLRLRTNTVGVNTFGTAEVWVRDSPGASLTVSATGDARQAPGGQLTVRTLIGAKAAASQTGATGTKSNDAPATVQQSVAAGTGNRIYGSAFNWDSSTAMTVLGNTTAITAFADATNGDNWAAFKSSGDTAGTATYGYSTSVRAQFSAVEILAAPDAGGSFPIRGRRVSRQRRQFRQYQPNLRSWFEAEPASAAGPSASGAAQDTDRTSGIIAAVKGGIGGQQDTDRTSGVAAVRKGGIGAQLGATRVSGTSAGVKGAIGAAQDTDRTSGRAVKSVPIIGAATGNQRSSDTTLGVHGGVGATVGQTRSSGIAAGRKGGIGAAQEQQRSSGLSVKGTPPTAVCLGQLRAVGTTLGIKGSTATAASGQTRSSGATTAVHRAVGASTGQLHTADVSAAKKAVQAAAQGAQRASGLVGTFVGITGGTLEPALRLMADLATAGRKVTNVGAGARQSGDLGTDDRDVSTLTGKERATSTLGGGE